MFSSGDYTNCLREVNFLCNVELDRDNNLLKNLLGMYVRSIFYCISYTYVNAL